MYIYEFFIDINLAFPNNHRMYILIDNQSIRLFYQVFKI